MGGYDKDFQGESPLLDSEGLSNQNGEEDVVQDNEDESDSSNLRSVLSRIARDNRRAAKMPTKNSAVISDNKV